MLPFVSSLSSQYDNPAPSPIQMLEPSKINPLALLNPAVTVVVVQGIAPGVAITTPPGVGNPRDAQTPEPSKARDRDPPSAGTTVVTAPGGWLGSNMKRRPSGEKSCCSDTITRPIAARMPQACSAPVQVSSRRPSLARTRPTVPCRLATQTSAPSGASWIAPAKVVSPSPVE